MPQLNRNLIQQDVKMNRRQLLSAVSGLVLAAGLSTGAMAQSSEPVSGGTLNVGFISDLRTMNPLQSTQ